VQFSPIIFNYFQFPAIIDIYQVPPIIFRYFQFREITNICADWREIVCSARAIKVQTGIRMHIFQIDSWKFYENNIV
jgi:hypothetical protein